MNVLSRIWFPATVLATAAVLSFARPGREVTRRYIPEDEAFADTVVYLKDAYKLKRIGSFDAVSIADSLLQMADSDSTSDALLDTLPHLTARDTIPVPDSLRLTDPFRYKYYVALIDSLTHVIVRDSLQRSSDSLKISADTLRARRLDSLARIDFEHAISDSLDWRMIDSIYVADSTAVAKEKFLQWYNSLSRKERRKYDMEQALPKKLAEMDSLQKVKEEKQAERDSVTEYTPRILETAFLTDTMQYKRIIHWTVDDDFQRLNVSIPDTSYNYHYYDYPFLRRDVNASWLGVPGSPLQYYNYFNRASDEGIEFYNAQEAWSFSPRTLPHYNTKTPHTELAYFGTLLAGDAKESDNLHILTTQNILPELNFTISYDRFGGGGMLESEETKNKTFSVRANYLGKKYLAHAGYIYNMVERAENGGIVDNMWIRDTTVEAREIKVALSGASSKITKNTWFLDQQYRIPFEFIRKLQARRDTSAAAPADSLVEAVADSLDRDVTTAFIGHSSEWSTYTRKYIDNITNADGKALYNNVFNFGPASADSLGTMKLDNKIFLRLQPWGSESIVSKLDVGVGDRLMHYFDSSSVRPARHVENSVYAYAGAQGQVNKYFNWDAKARFYVLGYNLGDMAVEANAGFNFYPFRRARKSPVSVSAHFETRLDSPTYYQQMLNTNHFRWENSFSKISTTQIRGSIDVPRWKLNASVGYGLLANNVYYDTLGIVRQNAVPMSILSASLRKEFVAGPMHFDNRVLVQYSSAPDVIPLPTVALNLRWYAQFVVQRDQTKTHNIMVMQVGVNGFYNSQWYAPAWNPALGVFHNQNVNLYENGPYFDIFLNIQWKKCCIFLKYQNFGKGWPMRRKDYFTADHYIGTLDGTDGLKLGIFWPFYFNTQKHESHSH
ncbi:MAG: putative porin [Bacteroidales bacterium]|nr:putative porin [Bacteroidales bacterium]